MSLLAFIVSLYAVGVLHALGHRVVSLFERESASRLARVAAKESVRLPADITARAALYNDEWARDAYIERAGELYEKTGDWQQVRALIDTPDE